MLSLLAQTAPAAPTTPSSGDFWNPANWPQFIAAVGIPGFFALIFLGLLVWFFWKGLSKWDRHLARQEQLIRSQWTLCRQVHSTGGSANVTDLREAGHAMADALLDIAKGINKDTAAAVAPSIARIHYSLRPVASPLPEVVPIFNDGLGGLTN